MYIVIILKTNNNIYAFSVSRAIFGVLRDNNITNITLKYVNPKVKNDKSIGVIMFNSGSLIIKPLCVSLKVRKSVIEKRIKIKIGKVISNLFLKDFLIKAAFQFFEIEEKYVIKKSCKLI